MKCDRIRYQIAVAPANSLFLQWEAMHGSSVTPANPNEICIYLSFRKASSAQEVQQFGISLLALATVVVQVNRQLVSLTYPY
jgi:hypothetical protein